MHDAFLLSAATAAFRSDSISFPFRLPNDVTQAVAQRKWTELKPPVHVPVNVHEFSRKPYNISLSIRW